ncbi:MAG: transporter substrate-binding domain-containing protein [Motiliproteus sp.]
MSRSSFDKPLVFLFFCFTFSLLATTNALAESQMAVPYRWVSEHYPPYNYQDENGHAKGMSVDVVKAIWERMEVPEADRKIEFMPWARGYSIAQSELNAVIFSTTYTDDRLEKFLFVGPVFPVNVVILARKSDRLQVTTVDQLNKLKLGVVRQDIGEQLLLKRGVDASAIVSTNSVHQLIKLLDLGRIDGIAYGYEIAVWSMRELNIELSQYEIVYPLLEGQLGFAFNKKVDKDQLQRMQAVLEALKSEGVLEKIRKNYLE